MSVHASPRPAESSPQYLAPYRNMMGRSGACFDTLLWTSRQTQMSRFRAITEMIDLTAKTIVDAGCGYGDFLRHLSEAGVAYGRYVGIDALDEHVAAARTSALAGANPLPDPLPLGGEVRAEFRAADFVTDRRSFAMPGSGQAQVIVFSGSLNTLEQGEAVAVLERAWGACSESLVFNFLIEQKGPGWPRRAFRNAEIKRFDAMAMLEWAMGRTPLVAYRQDYLEGQDGTVVMRVR